MEFSFENKCTVDQQTMTESVRSNRKTFVTLSRIPVVITGLGILSILARAVVKAQFDLPMLLRWTIFFLLFLRIATTPRRTARRVIKNFKSMYKVDSVEATTQFGDKIVYTLHGAETCEYDYSAIKKVISAKDSYILSFKMKVAVDSVEATTQFGDKILYTLHGAETCTYSYDAIRKVISAKDSYILSFKMKVAVDSVTQGKTDYVNKKSSISLKRDGFTQGDFESFKKFLAEKCPNVKIPE